jgi:hypothetical protein
MGGMCKCSRSRPWNPGAGAVEAVKLTREANDALAGIVARYSLAVAENRIELRTLPRSVSADNEHGLDCHLA